jgi:hypothetical protein
MYSPKPELNNNWIKASYKRRRSIQEESEREAKHTKESEHWFSQTSASNRSNLHSIQLAIKISHHSYSFRAMMSDVSFMVEIILRIARDVRSTRTYKR